VELGVAVFEGALTVTDAGRFVAALSQGIGRAKAYGCGLLTVAPLR
jgi:CRISPR system Cascade subunit CasE